MYDSFEFWTLFNFEFLNFLSNIMILADFHLVLNLIAWVLKDKRKLVARFLDSWTQLKTFWWFFQSICISNLKTRYLKLVISISEKYEYYAWYMVVHLVWIIQKYILTMSSKNIKLIIEKFALTFNTYFDLALNLND